MALLPVYSQENPVIDKDALIDRAHENPEVVEKVFHNAEKYYKKGSGYYGEALKYYLRLYPYAPDLSQLNYKIGVCCLNSSNQKLALQYMIRSYPDVAKDYYYQLGKALQYNLKYDAAKKAYESYSNTLKKWKKKHFHKELIKLTKECEFGAMAVRDSVPVFIKNLGPVINTYYDEYGAVLSTNGDSAIFFTSKRPRREPEKIKPRNRYDERLLVTNNCINKPSEEAIEIHDLKSRKNTSVSGILDSSNRLFFYKGKFHNGGIHTAIISGKTLDEFQMLRGKINHIAYQETSIAVANDSSVYFVSDRIGGQGGKDIWSCTWKKKNKYKYLKNLGPAINTPYDEEAVYVTPDGKTLYFSSNGHEGMGGFDVYKIEKLDNGKWSNPVNLGYPINSPANELFYEPTADSMIALMSTTRDGGFGGLDIHKVVKDPRIPFELYGLVTDIKDSSVLSATVSIYNYKTDELIASAAQDTANKMYSVLLEDGGALVAQIDAPGYRTLKDTLECPKVRHTRMEANYELEKLKYPFTLYGNIIDIKTGLPLQADVAFTPVDNDTLVLHRVTSNAASGNYSITFEDKTKLMMNVSAPDYYTYQEVIDMKKNPNDSQRKDITLKSSKITYYLTGFIYDEESGDIITGKVSFTKPGESESFAVSKLDTATNKYIISVEDIGPYIVEVNSEGYFFVNGVQEFTPDSTLELRNFTLKKMKTGAKIVVENILFNTGKSTLKPSSYEPLNKLADLLIENKNVRIEVSGHTDNVGSASINKKLSKARALSVRNYLLSRGVEEDRVEFAGYGFDQPIADNSTKEGRAQNRRVEIKVLE